MSGGDYEVGYGRPPKQHRFKPGNQAARKRDGAAAPTVSLASALEQALRTKRRIKRGNEVVTMAVGDILAERLVAIITTGSPREVIRAMELLERHAPKLLEQATSELKVTYHQAEGSRVPLPPSSPTGGSHES